MINIRLKPEEFPFKVIKRLLIRFVTPEVSRNMLNAKMQLAPHPSHQRNVPLLCCFPAPHSTAMPQTCQKKTFTYCMQQCQPKGLTMTGSWPPTFHIKVLAPHATIVHQTEGWMSFCSTLKQTKEVQRNQWIETGDNRKGTRTCTYWVSQYISHNTVW